MPPENRLSEHEYLVRVLARWLERNDYVVAAELADHTESPSFSGYKPHVYAMQAETRVIGDAEVCERLDDEQTQQRWKAFFSVASQAGSHPAYELHIIVPSTCLDEAKRQAPPGASRPRFIPSSWPTRRDYAAHNEAVRE